MSLSNVRVAVSAGNKNFHLFMSAEEVHRAGSLGWLACGAYPTPRAKRLLGLAGNARMARSERLLAREVDVPLDKIRVIWLSELIQGAAFAVRKLRGKPTTPSFLDAWTLKTYQSAVARALSQSSGLDLYHFRAGYGGRSVLEAKAQGMITLCDHSLADPRLLPNLVAVPPGPSTPVDPNQLDLVSRAMVDDIEAADAVLVNSGFVKKTLVACGYPEQKIHVIYLGVDDAFARLVPERVQLRPQEGPLRLLFAGFFSYRKGADTLIRALLELDDVEWTLDIAGAIDPRVQRDYRSALRSMPIKTHGVVSRAQLVDLMAESEIFVFPSRAEGSARVLFEAMACGCAIITTEQSGSIVVHGEHGRLVESSDPTSLCEAVRALSLDRRGTRRIGEANREAVLQGYRQEDYGRRLIALYRSLKTGLSQ